MNVFFKEKLDLFLKSAGISRGDLEKNPEYFYQFLETTAGLYHIYLKGNNGQNLVYTTGEFVQIINRMALAAQAKGIIIWAYAFLSNHLHILAQPMENEKQITQFKHHFRMSLTHYYNTHNNSEGMVGCRKCAAQLIRITRNLQEPKDILSYILRNPVRHKIIAVNPFEYKWSSIHYYFRTKNNTNSLIHSTPQEPLLSPNAENKTSKYLPGRTFLPDNWHMTQSGLICPESYLATEAVEILHKNYPTFQRAMLTPGERETANITRDAQLQASHKTRHANHAKKEDQEQILDIQISEYIATQLNHTPLPSLSLQEKLKIAKTIKKDFPTVSYIQLSRILSIPHSALYHLWNTI